VIESMDELNKIDVEPTNRCNLACVTCIRRVRSAGTGPVRTPSALWGPFASAAPVSSGNF